MRRNGPKTAPKPTSLGAVFYARVSSKEQEEGGFSLPAQLKAANAYAQANGLELLQEFIDVESAKKAGRRQFEQMCTYIRKNKGCVAIVVEKTDRLYRNLKDWVEVDELMASHDLTVHLYKENEVLSQASRSHQKFIHGIKVLMAKNFIDNLSEEVKKGMTEKASQGHYPHKAPVGYLNNQLTKRIEVDPERAPIVRKLFELYATGEYSVIDLREVAKKLGLTSNMERPLPLAKSGINRLLNNPIYHGEFDWREKRYQGSHAPIISKALYERVQAIMDGRDGGVYQEREFAFSGLLRCGHCGCQLTVEFKKQKYTYYRCTGNKGKCPEKYVREERIDEMLGGVLAALKLDDVLFNTLRMALKSSHEDEQAFLKQNLINLTGRQTLLQNRLQQLYVDKLDGQVDGATYDGLRTQWQTELDGVRREIQANQVADQRYAEFGIQVLELAQTAWESYSRRSLPEKRRLLNFVCWNCSLKDGKLTPAYREPFALLASTAAMLKERKAPDLTDRELSEFRGG